MTSANVTRVHHTGVSTRSWDSGRAERRTPDNPRAFRRAYAYVDAKKPENKTDAKFPHHEVTADGDIGAANVRACSNGIAILNGGRGGADITEGDRRGIYKHLAAHLRDAGRRPPDLG